MQIKTIKKVIEAKLTDWLSSITDEQLRQDLKNKILVSGGSITSMLLNEKVNDYDIYLKDMDVLIRVAKYYTDSFNGTPNPKIPESENNIFIMDGRKKEAYLNSYEKRGSDAAESNSYTISLRNLKSDQVKLHFNSERGGMVVNKDATDEQKLKYVPIFFSPNAISLSNDIQIVLRFHGDNEQVHKTFDFMHATNYFTFPDGLVTNKEALESIITKQLKYQGSLYPLTSIIRMKKFIKRGWNIGAGEILKIMFQISELDLKNPDILEDQLIGVDIAYFGKLIEILRGIDNPDMTSQYLNSIIDKVFNSSEEQE